MPYLDRQQLYKTVIEPGLNAENPDVQAVAKTANQLLRELEFVLKHFTYYIECQVATYQYEAQLARPRKGELSRHHGITEKMLAHAADFGIKPTDLERFQQRFEKTVSP